jgi:hypothetical protein
MRTLKAFVVEDSPIIRDSLVSALQESAPAKFLGEAEDEPTAVRWLNEPFAG